MPPRPRAPRRRPRRGSVERPVNGRLVRGTALLVGLPLLLAAFTVARPAPLPPPSLPPAFDTQTAVTLAGDLAAAAPDRSPGSPGALRAATWFSEQMRLYGFRTQADVFTARIPGRGRVTLRNLVAVANGRSPRSIVFMAHRDNEGGGVGANDNASGTAALIELARAYAPIQGSQPARPAHKIVFVSTDGGAFGALGAARFAETYAAANDVLAVISLDAVAGRARPRLELAGDTPRSPAATLVRTAAVRLLEEVGDEPRRPSALRQLVDLGFPFALHEQGPLVARGIPALTITTADDRPSDAFEDVSTRLSAQRLGELGRASQSLLASLDGGLELAQGTSAYLYLGSRIVRGWAIQLVLIAALLPFAIGAIDLFARCRRRRIPLLPAVRSFRSRALFWAYAVVLFALASWAGLFPHGEPRPLAPRSEAAHSWPVVGLAVVAVLLAAGWLTARERLLPRRPVSVEEQLAGHSVALLALGLTALVVVATNPFSLVFLLPSLYAWLWLPQAQSGRAWARGALLAAGLLGPALIVVSFAERFGLGLDALWYVASLVSVGYVPWLVVIVAAAWAAAAGQLAALASSRYAPYPAAGERPPRGPFRNLVRSVVLASRARRAPREERDALEG
jgi:hypothetical protein